MENDAVMDDCSAPTRLLQSREPQQTLILVSHAHARPLSHPPDLKYDLRKISNPPKHIRDAYDGRSKRLREHMLHDDAFIRLLETARTDVEAQVASLLTSDGTANAPRQAPHDDQVPVQSDASSIGSQRNAELIVSCFCERGKHRSVAFVEELSRVKWPKEVAVEVCHRDVEENRKKSNRQRGPKQQSTRRFMDSDWE